MNDETRTARYGLINELMPVIFQPGNSHKHGIPPALVRGKTNAGHVPVKISRDPECFQSFDETFQFHKIS
jgi:hypothetical protein